MDIIEDIEQEMDNPIECAHCYETFDLDDPANLHVFRTLASGFKVKRNACPSCGEWFWPEPDEDYWRDR